MFNINRQDARAIFGIDAASGDAARGWACLGLGGLMLGMGFTAACMTAHRRHVWSTTEGTIERFEKVARIDRDGAEVVTWRAWYRYDAAGRQFVASEAVDGGLIGTFSEGQTVAVHFDRTEPTRSTSAAGVETLSLFARLAAYTASALIATGVRLLVSFGPRRIAGEQGFGPARIAHAR